MGLSASQAMMKGALLLLGAVVAIVAGAGTYETELLRGIEIYNFRSKCWGKKNVDAYALDIEKARRECAQMESTFDLPGHGDDGPQNPFLRPNNNPFEKLTNGGDFSDLQSLWRTKREASEGLLDVDEDDFYEFLKQVKDHRHLKSNSMGNLTCVLQKFFFNCADRTERRVCTEAQLLENLEAFYGSESDEETADRIASVGLPENKYDAAAVSLAVLQHAKSEEDKFVERFLWDIDGDNF